MTIKAQTDWVVEMPVHTIPLGSNNTYLQSADGISQSIGVSFNGMSDLTKRVKAYKTAQVNIRRGGANNDKTQKKKKSGGKKAKRQLKQKDGVKTLTHRWTDTRSVYAFMEDIVIRPFNPVTNVPQTLRMTPRHLINTTGIFNNSALQFKSSDVIGAKTSGSAIEMGLKLADLVFKECNTVFTTDTPLVVKSELHGHLDHDELQLGLNRSVNLICARNNVENITYDDDEYNNYFKNAYKRLLDGFALDYSVAVACVEHTLSELKQNTDRYDPIKIDEYTNQMYRESAYKELEKVPHIVIENAKKNEVVQAAATHAFYDHLLAQYCKVHEVVISAILTLCKYFHMEPISSKFANTYFSHAVTIVNGTSAASRDITNLMDCFSDMQDANRSIASEFKSKLATFHTRSEVTEDENSHFSSKQAMSRDTLAKGTMSEQLRVLRDMMTVTVAHASGLTNSTTNVLPNSMRVECKLDAKSYHAMITLAAKIDTKGMFVKTDGFQHSADYKHYYGILNKLGRDLLHRSKDTRINSHLMVRMDEFKLPVKIAGGSLPPIVLTKTLVDTVQIVTTTKTELTKLLDGPESHNITLEMVERLHKTADSWNDNSLKLLMSGLQQKGIQSSFYGVVQNLFGEFTGNNQKKTTDMNKKIAELTGNHYAVSPCSGVIYEAAEFDMKYMTTVNKICIPKYTARYQGLVNKHPSVPNGGDGGGHDSSGSGADHGQDTDMNDVYSAQKQYNDSSNRLLKSIQKMQAAKRTGATSATDLEQLEKDIRREQETCENRFHLLEEYNNYIQKHHGGDQLMTDASTAETNKTKRKRDAISKIDVTSTPILTRTAVDNFMKPFTDEYIQFESAADELDSIELALHVQEVKTTKDFNLIQTTKKAMEDSLHRFNAIFNELIDIVYDLHYQNACTDESRVELMLQFNKAEKLYDQHNPH